MIHFCIKSMPVIVKRFSCPEVRKSGSRRLLETSFFLDSPLRERVPPRDSTTIRTDTFSFLFFFFFFSLSHCLRSFASFSSLYINAYGSLGLKTVGVSVRKADLVPHAEKR